MIESTPRAVGLGAGPGPSKTYYVDLPFPWGDQTPITLPVSQLSQDFADAAWPVLYARVNRAVPELYNTKLKPELLETAQEIKRMGTNLVLGATVVLAGAWFLSAYMLSRRKGGR